jgi:battenin
MTENQAPGESVSSTSHGFDNRVNAAAVPSRNPLAEESLTPPNWRTALVFFIFGLINNFAYVVFLSAAEDLLEKHAGAVLFADVVPGLLVKVSLGFWFRGSAYGGLVAFVSVTGTLAFLLAAVCAERISVLARVLLLVSISFISIAGALGEATFLALSAVYGSETLTGWSSGTGFAGVAGAASYALLVSGLGWRPKTSLLALALAPLMIAAAYQCLPSPQYSWQVSRTSGTWRPMKAVSDAEMGSYSRGEVQYATTEAGVSAEPHRALLLQLWRSFLLPLALVYFAEYSINQGVLPTFDGSPYFREVGSLDNAPASGDHGLYRRFQVIYQVAVFVSRSSIAVVRISRLWIFPVVQGVNLMLLSAAASGSRFFTKGFFSSRAIGCIVFLEGLLGGASYANTFWSIRHGTHPQAREWALAVSTVADAAGIAAASVFASFLECRLLAAQGRACNGFLEGASARAYRERIETAAWKQSSLMYSS